MSREEGRAGTELICGVVTLCDIVSRAIIYTNKMWQIVTRLGNSPFGHEYALKVPQLLVHNTGILEAILVSIDNEY